MPRTSAEKKDFTFIGGLNTEAGFQTFPENAWLDGDNVVPQFDGSIERREKLDLEASFTKSANSNSDANKQIFAYGVFRWDSAGGNGSISLTVVQQGDHIRFYGNSQSSLSLAEKSFSIDLNTYSSGGGLNTMGTSLIQAAFGNGKLIIVSEDTDPILVEYDPVGDSITVTKLTLKMRDFEGISDGLRPDERPSTLSAQHNYNLLNQGWTSANITTYKATGDALYPSNAQIWTEGKDSTGTFTQAALDKQFFGTSLAPKGHFILDIFNRDRSTVSGVGGITTETETGRPTTTAFFAGRAWYAGIRSTTVGSWVLFSQVVASDKSKYEKCYQSGDPTAEFTSDLIASDGGVIPIPESGQIVKLVPTQDSMLVFSQNGVWQIDGGTSGFAADAYHVHKVSAFGCVSPSSIVEVEDGILYWSIGDIFLIKRSDLAASSGDFSIQSISFSKIATLYDNITLTSKQYADSFYDIENKKIYWAFKSTTETNSSGTAINRFTKDKFLVFDTRMAAFYILSIESLAAPSPAIVGSTLALIQSGAGVNSLTVVTATDTVIVTSGDTVIAAPSVISGQATLRVKKFLTLVPDSGNWKLSFADFENLLDSPNRFMDWFSFDSVGAEPSPLPFLLTGYATGGDGTKIHQAPYIITFMKKTETGFDVSLNPKNPSSCTMQGHWEWTDNAIATRWSRGEEVYRHNSLFVPDDSSNQYVDGYPLVVAKTKVRGRGRALSLKFSSSSGKDMKLAGWSVLYAANTSI